MTKLLLVLALGAALAVPAYAQSGRNEQEDDQPGRASRDDADRDEDAGERPSRRAGRGEEGGRFGGPGGPGGGMFRRSNPMFEAIDADGNGVITAQELRKAPAALKKLDRDSDGNISLEEAAPASPFSDPGRMVDRMMERDANGDGKLTPDEVDERMAGMLRNADANQDGAVDREELTAAMEQMRQNFGRGGFFGGPGGPGGFGPGGDPQQMIGRLDRNGDGRLSRDEVPEQMLPMLQGGDQNGDGFIDAREMLAIQQRMAERFGRGGFGGRGGPGDRGGRAEDGDAAEEDQDRASRRPRGEREERDE